MVRFSLHTHFIRAGFWLTVVCCLLCNLLLAQETGTPAAEPLLSRSEARKTLTSLRQLHQGKEFYKTNTESLLARQKQQQKTLNTLTENLGKETQEMVVISRILKAQEIKVKQLEEQRKKQQRQLEKNILALHEHENKLGQQHKEIEKQHQALLSQKELARKQTQQIRLKYIQLKTEADVLNKQLHAIEIQKKLLSQRAKAINGQNWLMACFVFFILLFVVFAIIVFRRMKQRSNATALLTTQNQAITKHNQDLNLQNQKIEQQKLSLQESNAVMHHGLVYAKQIQQSILPPISELKEAFPESFVLFQPKDVVSGDFYLFHKHADGLLIGAADCTGHGVPGAFMTMIGSRRFQRAFSKTALPSEILRDVNISVKHLLHQSAGSNSLRDGMDASLCLVRPGTFEVSFAGANRPLWVIRAAEPDTVMEIKGTRASIGGTTREEQEYSSHTLQLQRNDVMYLFSDGFCDQFNPENQKMLPFRLKEKLLELYALPLATQQEQLEHFLQQWRGEAEQTDDILLIGIKMC